VFLYYGGCPIGRKYSKNRGVLDIFYIKNIFFIRKIPRVEPGRACTHHASVPFTGGDLSNRSTRYVKRQEFKFFFYLRLSTRKIYCKVRSTTILYKGNNIDFLDRNGKYGCFYCYWGVFESQNGDFY
jgi:hypothetical protein